MITGDSLGPNFAFMPPATCSTRRRAAFTTASISRGSGPADHANRLRADSVHDHAGQGGSRKLEEHVVLREAPLATKKIALIDVEGVLKNDRGGSLGVQDENPVLLFKEKLDARATHGSRPSSWH